MKNNNHHNTKAYFISPKPVIQREKVLSDAKRVIQRERVSSNVRNQRTKRLPIGTFFQLIAKTLKMLDFSLSDIKRLFAYDDCTMVRTYEIHIYYVIFPISPLPVLIEIF